MAIGDQSDALSRLNAVLPPWFGNDETPILTGLLNAYAYAGSALYAENAYVQLQMRITTATDTNLDLIAVDFFGINGLPRSPGEGDTSYRNRILATILEERATRRGMVNVLTNITGNAPLIFEPMRPADGGGYSVAGCGYSVAGGWSNPGVPYQCFITVYAPVTKGISNIAGWNIPQGAWNTGSQESWSTPNNVLNALTDTQVYNAINATKCEGTVCWTSIQPAV